MKCRAKETVKEERLQEATRTYGTLCLEAIQSRAALILLERWRWFRSLHAAGEDRLKTYFDGQAAAMDREMNGNAAQNIWVDGKQGRHRADAAERFEVVTDDAAYRLTRDLAYGGINAGRVLGMADACAPDRDPPGQDGIRMQARVAWYAWLGRRAIRTWIASAGLSLLDLRYPSGHRRIPIRAVEEEFLVPLAEFARDWCERFMDVQDRSLTAEQEARTRILQERYNIRLMPVEGGMPGEKKPEKKEEAAREIRRAPAEYEKILSEVGKGFGAGRRRT